MKKYIIKNCPCIYSGYRGINQCSDNYYKLCNEITDCLFKRIVERCNLYEFNYPVNQAIQMLTQNIKDMLKIEKNNE